MTTIPRHLIHILTLAAGAALRPTSGSPTSYSESAHPAAVSITEKQVNPAVAAPARAQFEPRANRVL